MKLLYRITWRISVALLLLSAAWGSVFFFAIIDEINDETDDSLERYSEFIIVRALAGEELPDQDDGTNNTYFLNEVTEEYALSNPPMRFLDDEVFIYTKQEVDPARILKTIFKNEEGVYHELTVLVPTIEKADLKKTILTWLLILYVGIVISTLTVDAIVLRRSLRPLYAILDWLNKLELGKEIPELKMDTDVSEYNKLSDSIQEAARRHNDMYEQQSLFIGHAAHELQTPIAIAQNRLELLAEDPALTQVQLEQIIKTRRSLENLSKLNKTLLLLTKIENRQFPETETVDVNETLHSLSDDLKEAYGSYEIDFSWTESAHLKVDMNRTLASVLFSNLLKNAFIHNEQHGKVSVNISADSVSIKNTASAGALSPEYIFRRFYQYNKSKGSVGLGLPLAESAAKLYGTSIVYSFEKGMHVFEVKFPHSVIVP